jgi:quinol monooxygenase YgiN
MHEPRHARIGFYTARPGDLDAVIERAREEVIPMLELEPGFRRYTVVRTGPDTLASITGWDTHAQAGAAARRLSAWVAEVMGPELISVENHIAEVVHLTESSPAAPAFGRVALWQFKPGMPAAIRPRVEGEFVPLLRRQPGFVRYIVFQIGEDRAITFTGFASHEQADAAAAAARPWLEANAGPAAESVTRQEGPVVWSLRAD